MSRKNRQPNEGIHIAQPKQDDEPIISKRKANAFTDIGLGRKSVTWVIRGIGVWWR